MTVNERTWNGLAKELVAKIIHRPFANRIAWLVATGGILIMVGPPLVALILSSIIKIYLDIQLPIQPPGTTEYIVGSSLVVASLFYSGWIHSLTVQNDRNRRDQIIALDAVLIDNNGIEIPCDHIFKGDLYSLNENEKISDYMPPQKNPFYISIGRANFDYYRDVYEYIRKHSNALCMSFRILNTGKISAKNIVTKITYQIDGGLEVIAKHRLPSRPQNENDHLSSFAHYKKINRDTKVSGDTCQFSLDALHPGDIYSTNTMVCVRPNQSSTLTILLRIYAEDLPEPISKTFLIETQIDHKKITEQDIVRLGNASGTARQ